MLVNALSRLLECGGDSRVQEPLDTYLARDSRRGQKEIRCAASELLAVILYPSFARALFGMHAWRSRSATSWHLLPICPRSGQRWRRS